MISSEFIIVIFEPASPDDILVYSSLSGFMRISCNSAIELAVIEKNIIKDELGDLNVKFILNKICIVDVNEDKFSWKIIKTFVL